MTLTCAWPRLNAITERIIAAAIKVHRALGPGLLESAYLACVVYELKQAGLHVRTDVPLPLVYEGVHLDCGYRIDLIVEQTVIVELKSVAALAPTHQAQLITYLKLTGIPAGLLINFNVPLLETGHQACVEPSSARP